MHLIINKEICRPIPNFSRYHISSSGRIYRTKPVYPFEERLLEESKAKFIAFREVKSKASYSGNKKNKYLRCGLKKDNSKLTTNNVAFLVMSAFELLPKEEIDYFKIIHIDGDITNCNIDNLRFEKKQPRNHILKKEDIPKIRELIKQGCVLRHIAREFGVCEMQIQRIKTGENWSKRRKIYPKKLPFQVKDPKIRNLLRNFEETKLKNANIKSPFTIKRDKNDATNNLIVGRINGYKFINNHKNISRARTIVDKLNRYFFCESIADRYTEKLNLGMHKKINDLTNRSRINY